MAATFSDRAVAASYQHRPSYPDQLFPMLARRIRDEPRTVLDLGCGTGLVARPLAPLVDRVDAVDISEAMIEEGKRLPGGNDPRIRWIVGRAEDAELCPPYALITAGDSLHWMDWGVLLPRLTDALSPAGLLAIASVDATLVAGEEVREGIVQLIKQFTTYSEWRPDFDLVAELEHRHLFRLLDREATEPTPFQQAVDGYVESFHARASLSWQRMSQAAIGEFDARLSRLLRDQVGETVTLRVCGTVTWGRPLRP